MSTSFSDAARHYALVGSLTYLTGQTVTFSGQHALDFSRSEGVSDGFLLGGALSASYTLNLYDGDGRFTLSHAPYGASVSVYLKDEEDESYPLGQFIVSYANRAELTGVLTLSGSDAMATAFEGLWEDPLAYPVTLGALASAMASQVGMDAPPSFPGSSITLTEKPPWGEISVRQALSFLCEAAGCFAGMDDYGCLFLKPAHPTGDAFALSSSVTFSRTVGDSRFGPLAGFRISLSGASREEEPLVVQESGAVLTESNCLHLSGNPLFARNAAHTAVLAQHLLDEMQGFSLRHIQIQWSGDPSLSLGSRITSSFADGDPVTTIVTRQTLRFSNGFSMESDCTLDRKGSTVGRLFTSSGALNAAMLRGEVDGALIRANSIAASSIVSGSIAAEQLAAASVTAEKLSAGSVTAQKLSASSVTTEKLAASAVTADKLAASAVTADHIAADAVEAHHLSADALSAIDAEIGSANIGYAQIKDASVQNLITKDAIADRYFIQKLMVQNLQVIEQTVQNLVVKASNGNYYRLDVNENTGAVTSTQVTVTAGEISAGVTTSGRSIIDTDILAADLSATNIKGANALIDRITASRLDVGELFARQAFISQLNTTDIRSNTYLQAYVGQQIDLSVGPIAIGNINWFENSDGYYEVTGPSSNTSFQFAFGDIAKHWNLFRGKQITVSFDIELENATGNGTGVFIEPQFWFSDSSYQSFQIVYTLNSTPRTLSARAAKTFTVQDKALDHVAQSGIYIYGLTGGRVKVGRPKLEIGSKATEWTLATTELKNTSVNINRQGIYMNTGGIIDMKAGTAVNISGADGMIDIRGNGTIGATSGNFTDLMVGGKQIGVTDFLMPVPCKFTQGQSSAPAGHGFLWLNASGSSYSQASAQGAPAVGYLPQTFNISAPTNVLSSGTFDYSLTFAVTHRQASTPGSITVNVAVKITNPTTGANLTFNFGSVTLRLWQSVTRTITITGSSINLMGANAALRAECSRTAGTVLTYLDSNVNLVLTATKQNAGGAQSVTMQYVP